MVSGIVANEDEQPNCQDVQKSDDVFVGSCEGEWKDLKPAIHPCQSQVGFAWIYRKLKKHYSTSKDAQKEIEGEEIPVVLGPDFTTSKSRGRFYLVDKHHSLSALDYSGFDKTKVNLAVICDLRSEYSDEESFWGRMVQKNLVYLKSHPPSQGNTSESSESSEESLSSSDGATFYNQLPVQVDPSSLPASFEFNRDKMTFTNDPWRALASYTRKVNIDTAPSDSCSSKGNEEGDKHCMRCMYRGCQRGESSEPFFEFLWGGFMNNASFITPSLWGEVTSTSGSAKKKTARAGLEGLLEVYNKLGNEHLFPGSSAFEKVDVDAWTKAASILIELCRFSDLDGTKDSLPGAVSGYKKLKEDPSCSLPQC